MRIGQFNKNIGDSYSFSAKNNDVTFGSLSIKPDDLSSIIEVIKDTDAARLDGSVLGVYRYSDFMVKSPDAKVCDTVLKEFYALVRMQQSQRGCTAAPIPVMMSEIGERPFLVEEYIQGRPNPQGKYTLTQATSAISKLLCMDKTGVINQDLSPANTIYSPEKSTIRFIDFDTFSYISKTGRVRHSQSTPLPLFKKMLDEIDIKTSADGILYGPDEVSHSKQVSQMFANSFAYKRRRPEGLHSFLNVVNMSGNPYISAPSNITNYESRTIFNRIMAGDVDDPCEFLLNYLQIKGRIYHKGMKEYLQNMEVSDLVKESGETVEKYSFDQAKERLKNAIEYEDFMSHLFEKKPDKYFAMLEAAKMQLNALLFHEDLDKRVPNYEQVGAAYNTLINLISEGLYDYREPEYQRYLNAEMDRYTEAFAHTNFSSGVKKPVVDSLDILTAWFSDIDKDPNSFSVVRQKAKTAIRESLSALCKQSADYELPSDEIKRRYTLVSQVICSEALKPIKDTFTDNQFDVQKAKVIDEALDEFIEEDLKRIAKDAKEAALAAAEAAKKETNNGSRAKRVINNIISRPKKYIRHFPPADVQISEYTKEYTKKRYIYQGGFVLPKVILAAAGIGFGIYKFIKYKNNKNSESSNNSALQTKTPVISSVTSKDNSPFKNFNVRL